jgi:hypothetical protein
MKKFVFPLLIVILYIFFIVSRIHSSSIGNYYQFFYGAKKDPNLIFGQPRAIRSDEWLAGTPKIIAAYQSGFPQINPLIGFGENFVVSGLPAFHWRAIFQPHYWLYFVLPLENGFSAMWWFNPLMMIIGVYFLVYLFKKRIFPTIFFSLILFFSPFNQWWTYSLSSFLFYGSSILISWYFLINSNSKIKKILSIFGLIYFTLCYAFIQYPPFQVSVGWLIVLIALAILLDKRKDLKRKDYVWIIAGVILTSVISLGVLAKFYFEFKDVISIIQNTVYPGKRSVTGGAFSLLHFLNGFYNIQLLDDFKGSASFGNQSEASNFFMVSFFMLPIYFFVIVKKIFKREKIDFLFFFIFLYYIFSLYYVFFGFPSFFAKITLLYLVPSKRMLIGLGIANYLLALFYLYRIKINKNFDYTILSFITGMFAFFSNLYIGYYLKQNFPVFIQSDLKIFLISSIAGLLVFFLSMQYQKLFLSLLIFFSIISTYRVNPLYKGLDPLINTEFAKKIREIKQKEGDKVFVYYGPIILENYFAANGVRQLGGVHYYPHQKFAKIFDPEGKYENVWNRYAHIIFVNNPEVKKKFILNWDDSYSINVLLCDNAFKRIDPVFVITKKLSFSCLKKVDSIDYKYFFYKIRN